MKTLLRFLLGLCLTSFMVAQPAQSVGVAGRSPDELQKLLSPIAIYPDALIAIILPAATATSDIVLASRYLQAGGDPAGLDSQSWEPSVISLSRYPEVVKWMDQNLEWTRELGEAFANQPADVMNAVQELRKKATQAGLLTNTPQQSVVVRDEEIYIEPTQPDVIYIPTYDPDVIYLGRPYNTPWLGFSLGFATGSWLYYDCDWRHHSVYVYHRTPGWVYRPDWRSHDRDRERNGRDGHSWTPSPGRSRFVHTTPEHARRALPRVEPPRFAGNPPNNSQSRDWNNGRSHENENRGSTPGSHAPNGLQQREDHSGVRQSVGPRPAPNVAPVQKSGPENRTDPTSPKVQGQPGAPSASVSQHFGSSRISRVEVEQRHYIHDNGASPQIQVPPAPTAGSRPERVGSLSPREGGRTVQRAPDTVSAPRTSHVETRSASAPVSRDSRNVQDDRGRRQDR